MYQLFVNRVCVEQAILTLEYALELFSRAILLTRDDGARVELIDALTGEVICNT
jgi:hypothetical protein